MFISFEHALRSFDIQFNPLLDLNANGIPERLME